MPARQKIVFVVGFVAAMLIMGGLSGVFITFWINDGFLNAIGESFAWTVIAAATLAIAAGIIAAGVGGYMAIHWCARYTGYQKIEDA